MGLNTSEFVASAEAQQQAGAKAGQSGMSGAHSEATTPLFSFSSGFGFEDANSLQTGSTVMTALKKVFEEKYKDTNVKTRVLPLLRETHGEKYRYSSLVVSAAAMDRSSGVMNIAYHIVLIEASNPIKPDPYRNNTNGGNLANPTQQVNLPRFACDGLDALYVDEARKLVERSYSSDNLGDVKRLQVIYANTEVIPDTVKLDDPEKVGELAVNALMACVAQLKRLSNQPPLNLAQTEPTPFTIEHIFRDGTIEDLVGRPVRSDLIVKLTARTNGRKNGFSLNGGSDGVPVAMASMFVDTVYTGRSNGNNNGFNLFKKPDNIEPCFVPRVVVTNSINYKGNSLEMQLLNMYGCYSVYEAGAANRSMVNKQVKRGDLFDMTDIGAFNVLANINNEGSVFGPIYSVRGADVADNYRYGLLDTVLRKVPLMAVDCVNSGPNSWQTAVWQQAGEGGDATKIAGEAFIMAAMNLTNGLFAQFFTEGTPVIVDRQLIPLGDWTDNEGMVRDIREFDNLAMLNRYGADKPEQVSKWIISQTDKSKDEAVRLSDTIALIDDASGYRARHTGRGVRVTLNPLYMTALSEAIKLTKHTFTPSDMYTDIGNSNLRGAQFLNWSQIAANASLHTSAYNKAGLGGAMNSNLFNNIFNV